ncbi:MAG TPA: MFS transporter [Gaiellaceae bacterium]|nr:MFS transporter [Gaiellaceae bacterium]
MRRADPTRLYYALTFLRATAVGWVVFDLFLVRDLKLSPLELILMGTVMEATIFVFEVPTGVVADTYSRRLSLIIGFIGMGAAVVLVGASSAAWLVIVLWGLWGLSYTFTSGAFEAWLADEVGAANVGSLFLRGKRVGFAGALVGLGVGVAVGVWSLRAAVIVSGVIELSCGLVCVVAMPETGFRRRPRAERQHVLRELWTTAASGVHFVRGRTLVLVLVTTELFAGFGAEAFDRLTEAHVIRDVGIPASINPVFAFAAVSVVTMVFGFAAVGRVIRRVDCGGMPTVARMLVVFTLATIVGQIAFALARGFWVVMIVFLAALLARGLLAPLYTTWLNRQITDSSVRATVLSISGQADAIGQATGGPVLGVVGNAFGIPAALVAGALTTLPAAALYGRALRHGGAEPELEELPQPAAV